MGDAAVTRRRLRQELFLKCGHLAYGTDLAQLTFVIAYHQPGRVIATIFETLEPFEQNTLHVALSNGTNDATHGDLLSYSCA